MPGTRTPAADFPRPRIGVSACLLGEPVRYDGGHKRHAYLVDILARHLDCLAVCPEAGIGLGVPRPPIHLVGSPAAPRALGVENPALDVTAALQEYAGLRGGELDGLNGFLFKRDSPSCGLSAVKLYSEPGRGMRRRATGIFAAAVHARLPWLPLEQEDALDDPRRRAHFLTRVYTLKRWQILTGTPPGIATLRSFHRAHAHLVMAHSQAAARRLDRLLATAPDAPSRDLAARYFRELQAALARPDTPARHYRVQCDLLDRLQPSLSGAQRARLQARLLTCRDDGEQPATDALNILRGYLPHAPDCALPGGAYLFPFPDILRSTPPFDSPEY